NTKTRSKAITLLTPGTQYTLVTVMETVTARSFSVVSISDRTVRCRRRLQRRLPTQNRRIILTRFWEDSSHARPIIGPSISMPSTVPPTTSSHDSAITITHTFARRAGTH